MARTMIVEITGNPMILADGLRRETVKPKWVLPSIF
jgi:hypothetical protein